MTRAADLQTRAGGAGALAASGRMAGEERRQQLLRVAMRLFSQRGFRGTTTKEIAQAAGVSEAMVFRHFATKEELYNAIIDFKACAGGFDPRQCLAEPISRRDDRAVFEDLARTLMEHHEQDQDFLRLLSHAALEEHQLTDMFWERNVLPMYDFLGQYIRERQREGALRQFDPAIIIRAFLGMVIHHTINNTLWDKKRRLLDISNERAAREFTDILLGGVAANTPPPGPKGAKKKTKKGERRAATR
ncbi:MAG TPA: helix-turn-helix domain-containing protein [Pyrinomonadaceae bacterium]